MLLAKFLQDLCPALFSSLTFGSIDAPLWVWLPLVPPSPFLLLFSLTPICLSFIFLWLSQLRNCLLGQGIHNTVKTVGTFHGWHVCVYKILVCSSCLCLVTHPFATYFKNILSSSNSHEQTKSLSCSLIVKRVKDVKTVVIPCVAIVRVKRDFREFFGLSLIIKFQCNNSKHVPSSCST